ncbi:MAG: hypothetical protein PHF00_06635 [Elusimicrobia bacterium]|nr:hypothetical protein [Elusimicrobiota bacterium]
MSLALAAALWLAAAPAAGQGVGVEPAPDLFSLRRVPARTDPEPLAQALESAFGPATWARVQVSTAGPVADLSALVRGGFYKLELIELTLMSAQAGRPLRLAVEKRRKGAKLAALAKDYGLDYGRLYEAALAVQELVDREYLPRFPEKQPRKTEAPSWQDSD